MDYTRIYNKIGEGYNQTRKADPYIAGRILDLLSPDEDKLYLDIGCGTGNYTLKLAGEGVNFVGVEPSEVMLNKAKAKSDDITWIQANAEEIPLPEGYFDGAIGVFTIQHWDDLVKGFSEVARVLKPGSKFVVFTFTTEQKRGYWFNYFFPEMMARAIAKSQSLETVRDAAEKSGLEIAATEKYFVTNELQDMFGYCGKHNPEVYFDPRIRNGIYMFTALNIPEEESAGLEKLRNAIDNDEFDDIKRQYENEEGDYLFVVLTKK